MEIYFSLEGERWQEDYLSHEPKQDKVSERARTIHIDLENRTAKHIMLKLKFQHEWILISEITFKSGKLINFYMKGSPGLRDLIEKVLIYYIYLIFLLLILKCRYNFLYKRYGS